MKGETKSAGFTIVETLIVLAVTGALFLSVVTTLSGRQNKAQFQQAVRDIQSKVQQTINEVSSGYYPNAGDFSCTATGIDTVYGGTMPAFSSTPSPQGTNGDCVFLGKIMQFSVGPANTVPEQYNTYTIAGLRTGTTLATMRAVVVDLPTVTQSDYLSNGLTTKSMCYSLGTSCLSPPTNSINTVGFISQIGSLGSDMTYEAGALDLVTVSGPNLNWTDTVTKARISSFHLNPPYGVFNPAGGITICFQSRNFQDTAVMTIGSNGHNIAVKVDVKAC